MGCSYLCEGNAIVSRCEGKAIGGSYLCEGNALGCSSVSVHLLFYFYQSHVLRAVPSPSLNLACWLAVGTADPSSNY